ncbi:hypothetical protein EVAR_18653_1 [Eumeta japonica]|uniref:Uncharacterized protein n=1 Tax=Eumeta variegata TaxID=151549 RepID=A0A4C1U6L3_EUMVA|nr:hypothetical protein EVAR_18653_1 [Eumeta japonica]
MMVESSRALSSNQKGHGAGAGAAGRGRGAAGGRTGLNLIREGPASGTCDCYKSKLDLRKEVEESTGCLRTIKSRIPTLTMRELIKTYSLKSRVVLVVGTIYSLVV